ncbi:MAG TPA: hypothetical protein VMI75_04480 [Polyangiaceae bacterium]|nr:hypothetical protein [Polyangiaceae bacterium]
MIGVRGCGGGCGGGVASAGEDINEWGLAQSPSSTPTTAPSANPAVDTLIGAGVGVAAGALVGAMAGGHAAVGAVAGALLGAGGGYWYSEKQAAAAAAPAAPTPTAGGGLMPAGPYTLLQPPSGGSVTMRAGNTYLVSYPVPSGSTLATELATATSEITAAGWTVLGAWSGLPPSGWPATDPNAMGGVFLAIKNGTQTNETMSDTNTSVYATGGSGS